MNLYSLPSAIRNKVEEQIGEGEEPVCIARSSSSSDGAKGESYLVALPSSLMIFSRTMGNFDYTDHEISLPGGLQSISTTENNYDLFLNIGTAENQFSLKFAKYMKSDIEPLLNSYSASEADAQGAPAPPPPPPSSKPNPPSTPSTPGTPPPVPASKSGPLTPFEVMISALIFTATCDGKVSDNENRIIHALADADTGSFERAHSYYENGSLGELLSVIAGYNLKQKLCILANVIEVCMCDGVLESEEQSFIKNFCELAAISKEKLRIVYDALLIKNQTSVLER